MTTSTAREVYTMEMIPATDRVQALAYQRSALNVGFTLGAALAGVALFVGTPAAYRSLVLANAVVTLLATLFVLRHAPRCRDSGGPGA
jgi:predicted MFS family arabinose efflux permease